MANPNIRKPTTDEAARDMMQCFITAYSKSSPYNNFDNPFNRSVTISSARLETATTSALATSDFTIPALYGNNPDAHTVHGGAVAMFFDNATSLPLLAVRHWWDGWSGVTRNLNITYLRPLHEGDRVVIEAEVVQCGKRNALISGVLKREKDGVILATCQHEKVRPESRKSLKL